MTLYLLSEIHCRLTRLATIFVSEAASYHTQATLRLR